MRQTELNWLVLKALPVWLLLSLLMWYCGEALGTILFPLFKAVLIFVAPDLAPSLKMVKSAAAHGHFSIELTARALRPVYLNASKTIAPGTRLSASLGFFSSIAPMVFSLALLTVWPVQRFVQRLLLMALAVLGSLVEVVAIVPLLLLSLMEISFQEIAVTGVNPRPPPWFLDWAMFCNSGGNWLLAIVGVLLCWQIQQSLVPDCPNK
jgi:hypothetical protein